MTRSGSRGLTEVRPREVAGYQAAAAQGRIPCVTPTPPALLAGPTAARVLRRALAKSSCWAAAAVGGVVVTNWFAWGAWSTLPLVALTSAVFISLYLGFRAVGRRNIDELQRGYTTVRLSFGSFLSETITRPPELGVPWDYSGVWVLADDGSVKVSPREGGDPPGMYPSPHRPGHDELWSGAAWTGYCIRS